MYLTDLAAACRTSGLPVVEVAGWRTRGHGGMVSVRSISDHHTATSNKASGDYPTLRVVRDGHGNLRGPLSQLGLGRNGTIYVIAAGRCYHAGTTFNPSVQGNSYAIGIEAEHSGSGPWPKAQYDAYVKLNAALTKWYKVPTTLVFGHKEIAKPSGRKNDPNFSMGTMRVHTTAYARTGKLGTGASGGTSTPAPKSEPTPQGVKALGSLFTEDGILDRGTVIMFQRIYGSDDDGVMGPESLKAMQRWAGLVGEDVDGVEGPTTRTALAKKMGLSGDEYNTVVKTKWEWKWTEKPTPMTLAMEKYWNKEYKKAKAAVPVPKPIPSNAYLTITGTVNKSTVMYIQAFLNVKDEGKSPDLVIDGWFGSKNGGVHIGNDTMKKLQLLSGAKQTGVMDGQSARALEKWLGLPETKINGWYPGLFRGLQRLMNGAILSRAFDPVEALKGKLVIP